MKIEYSSVDYRRIVCDLLVFPIFKGELGNSPLVKALDAATGGLLKQALDSKEFTPEMNGTCRLRDPKGLKARALLLVGAGKKSDFSPARLRELAGTGIRVARSTSGGTVAMISRGVSACGTAAQVSAEGALYGDYESDLYKTRDRKEVNVKDFIVIFEGRVPKAAAREGIRRGSIVGEATNFARTLVNEPSNMLTPSLFAERALETAAESGLECRVMEREEMEKLGMNTLLSVSRGSAEPPKMVILKTRAALQRGGKGKPVFGLIGKGVTFDSGGISLKPAENMQDMKGDMAGGAAVLGAMMALGKLNIRKPVVGLIPLVENMPGGRATKPGDVVRSYLGKTVEIINTDAEGRLIMADALYHARKLGARRVLDIATLTGACVVALGHVNAGMMGTDQKSMDLLRGNCSFTGEKVWQLPIDDDYRKTLRSEIADVKNVGDRWGGAITAAKFLQEFTESTPWVHLDIAGMDLDHDGRPFACKGSTGFGVRTLVRLIETVQS